MLKKCSSLCMDLHKKLSCFVTSNYWHICTFTIFITDSNFNLKTFLWHCPLNACTVVLTRLFIYKFVLIYIIIQFFLSTKVYNMLHFFTPVQLKVVKKFKAHKGFFFWSKVDLKIIKKNFKIIWKKVVKVWEIVFCFVYPNSSNRQKTTGVVQYSNLKK